MAKSFKGFAKSDAMQDKLIAKSERNRWNSKVETEGDRDSKFDPKMTVAQRLELVRSLKGFG